MKTLVKLAAVAAVAGLATSPVLAEGPTLYGKVNVTYQYNDKDGDDQDHWELQSNASRLGVKGELEVTEALTGIYKLEYEVAVDDGDTSSSNSDKLTFKQRNIYAGLKGSFGTVFFGTHDTPVKVAGKKIDLFNDYKLGDFKTTLGEGENRVANTLSYKSPTFGPGLQGWVMLVPGEDDSASSNDDNGIADGISASLVLDTKKIFASLSFDSDIDAADTTLIRGAIQGKFGPAKVGLLLQSYDADSNADDIIGYALSGSVKVGGNNVIKAQISGNDTEGSDPVMFSLGFDHKFTKKSKVFAFVTSYDADNLNARADVFSLAVGLEHKF